MPRSSTLICVYQPGTFHTAMCCVAGYAYIKMIEAAKAARGELILVILGPLTNVALACKLDPHLPSRGEMLSSFSNQETVAHHCAIALTAATLQQIYDSCG